MQDYALMPVKEVILTDALIPTERIERIIVLIRGQKVLLDRDLTALYGMEIRVLNETVRRNRRSGIFTYS